MQDRNDSTLSTKRIVISLAVFFLIEVVKYAVDLLIDNDTISMMFALNLGGTVLIMYDWNLFGLHYNRAKKNIGDTILFTVIGIVFLAFWYWFNVHFLHGRMLIPDFKDLEGYHWALPAVLIAFSYMHAAVVNICFKCLTDHINVRNRELAVILISGFLFGAVYTLVFVRAPFTVMISTYFYNVILISFQSYLYNQSGSFIPSILAMGTVYLIAMLMNVPVM